MKDFKPLLKMGEKSAVERVVDTFKAAGVEPIVVVTGNRAAELEGHLSGSGAVFVQNENFAVTSMFESVKIGLDCIKDKCDRILFTPVDVPLFSVSSVFKLVASGADIALPVFGGASGHPICIKNTAVTTVLSYTGSGGLRGAIENPKLNKEYIAVDDEGVLWDMDTPSDYKKLKNYCSRRIWLVRHGEPELPNGKSVCLGRRANPPLSPKGERQAKDLAEFFLDKDIHAVYASPLIRSAETARILACRRPVFHTELLTELDCGTWDGLPFDTIKKEYPELYALRQADNSIPPLGGETQDSGCNRLCAAIDGAKGNCVFVAHAGLIRALLSKLTDTSNANIFDIPQPYGCVNELVENEGKLVVLSVGAMPQQVPSQEVVRELYTKCSTSREVIEHSQAAARIAAEIADKLNERGHAVDRELLVAAALLHDILRPLPKHDAAGADFLLKQGYPKIAGLVREHHNLSPLRAEALDEAAILFFADKLTLEAKRVTLEVRFAATEKKCAAAEAEKARLNRFNTALRIRRRVFEVCGEEF